MACVGGGCPMGSWCRPLPTVPTTSTGWRTSLPCHRHLVRGRWRIYRTCYFQAAVGLLQCNSARRAQPKRCKEHDVQCEVLLAVLSIRTKQAHAKHHHNTYCIGRQERAFDIGTVYIHLPKGRCPCPDTERAGDNVSVLDVGCGANAIYPLLGAALHRWRFVGSDVTDVALEWAERNAAANPHLAHLIKLRRVEANSPLGAAGRSRAVLH